MMDRAPRVLFLTSSAFNRVTGGGITFSNLFAGWPKDAIATVHNDPVPVSTDVCDRFFRLTEREIHRWGWLRHVPLGKPPVSISAGAPRHQSSSLSISLLKRVKTWLFGDAIPDVAFLTPELEEWVETFRPEVIYTILGSNAMMELAERLRARFRLPLVIHIMDDWVSVLYKGGLLSPFQRRKKERLMQHLVDVSAARLATRGSASTRSATTRSRGRSSRPASPSTPTTTGVTARPAAPSTAATSHSSAASAPAGCAPQRPRSFASPRSSASGTRASRS